MSETHPKREFLESAGALHRHPERVQAELFERHRFFDPLDKVQVKYEMLRAHEVKGETVVDAADAFGYSRQTFYMARDDFEACGMLGLAEEKRGRRGPVKLTRDAIEWVEALAAQQPDLSGEQIAVRLGEEWGIVVHRRTIERVVAERVKKNRGR